jgi:hypothetical protein
VKAPNHLISPARTQCYWIIPENIACLQGSVELNRFAEEELTVCS